MTIKSKALLLSTLVAAGLFAVIVTFLGYRATNDRLFRILAESEIIRGALYEIASEIQQGVPDIGLLKRMVTDLPDHGRLLRRNLLGADNQSDLIDVEISFIRLGRMIDRAQAGEIIAAPLIREILNEKQQIDSAITSVLRLSEIEADRLRARAEFMIALFLGMQILCIVGVFLVLYRTIIHKIIGLKREIGDIREGKLEFVTTSTAQDEIGDLAREFNRLADQRKVSEEANSRLELKLRQAHKMEAIGTMAGGIAHDFNNMLAVILGNADLILTKIGEGPSVRKFTGQIIEASERARDLVNQILTFSRQTEPKLEPVDLCSVVQTCIKLSRSVIPTTIVIVEDIREDCGTIMADTTQLHRLFMNLFTNAEYAMDGEGRLEVKVGPVGPDFAPHAELLPGPYVRFSVADTGCGMDEETRMRVFDPFFTTKKMGEGTGMGLSLVMGIVQSHGGMITVDSTLGEGTTFEVYFPIIAATVEQDATAIQQRDQGDEAILFVDDEQMLVDSSCRTLQDQGYEVTPILSGRDALALFESDPYGFDLVITDQNMPSMSGMELAAALLNIRPDIPIILCTGFSKKATEEKSLQLGVQKFCLKPLHGQELTRTVREVLDGRQSADCARMVMT